MQLKNLLSELDGLGIGELVRRKEVSPREVITAALERLCEQNSRYNAVIAYRFEEALIDADNICINTPFAGVPYLLKDTIEYPGLPLTLGSNVFRQATAKTGMYSECDEVVARSLKAGLVILGRTNMCEFGLLPTTMPVAYGATLNPLNTDYSVGGSSGGAAAAVASSIVPLAHASDGGGSIRIPASCCGLFGFKPGLNTNPIRDGEPPEALVMEHCISRSVRDSAVLFHITSEGSPFGNEKLEGWQKVTEALQQTPTKLLIGVLAQGYKNDKVHPDCEKAVLAAAKQCMAMGHNIEEWRPTFNQEQFISSFAVIWSAVPGYILKQFVQCPSGFGDLVNTIPESIVEQVEPFTRWLLDVGECYSASDLWLAWRNVSLAATEVRRDLKKFDLLLMPVCSSPPLRKDCYSSCATQREVLFQALKYAQYTPLANVAGIPAMSVPGYLTGKGLPVGVQFVADRGNEALLFRLAYQFEQNGYAHPKCGVHPILNKSLSEKYCQM